MLDRATITHVHWQCRLGRGGDDATGEIAAGIADVEQSIRTICLTEKGSVPGAPEKCIRLMAWIDRRPDAAIPSITREVWEAIAAFEPRVVVEAVEVAAAAFGQWRVAIGWRLAADVSRQVHRMTLDIAASGGG